MDCWGHQEATLPIRVPARGSSEQRQRGQVTAGDPHCLPSADWRQPPPLPRRTHLAGLCLWRPLEAVRRRLLQQVPKAALQPWGLVRRKKARGLRSSFCGYSSLLASERPQALFPLEGTDRWNQGLEMEPHALDIKRQGRLDLCSLAEWALY